MTQARPFEGFICPTCNHQEPHRGQPIQGAQPPACPECDTTMRPHFAPGRGKTRPQHQRRTY